jgi:hypothetical protein
MSAPILDPTALADQLQAATTEARRLLARAAHAEGVPLAATAPGGWLAQQAANLVQALTSGTGQVCPHLGPCPTVVRAAVWAPGRLVCPDCIDTLRPDPAEDDTCDRCRRHTTRLYAGAAAFGPIILGYGLCRSCAAATGLTPAGQHQQPVTNRRPSHRPPVRHQRR